MCRTGQDEPCESDCPDARFSALLEDSVEDLYEHAPCGYLSTMLDGTIATATGIALYVGYGGWLVHDEDFCRLTDCTGN